MRKATALSFAFAFAAIAACGDDVIAPGPGGSASLVITPPAATVYEADAVVLSAIYRDSIGNVVPNAPVTWSVQDTARAMPGGNGYLLALKNGVVKVTAKSSNITATYDLTIVRPTVQNLVVSPNAPTLARGDVATIGVKVEGPGGRVLTGRAVTLSSDNPNVASIDASGRVRGIAAGVTTIRATSEGAIGSAQVTVSASNVVLNLSQFNGVRLPMLLLTDTVMWDGVPEIHELYVESGTFMLSGSPLRYNIKVNLFEYNVVVVNGQKQLQPRVRQSQADFGLVQYDARGDLQLTSEYVSPLSHSASPQTGGMFMRFRLAGDDEVWQLFFRREPE